MSARCQVDCMQWLQSCRLRISCVCVFDAAGTPEILKNQHAVEWTVCNDHGADFWEFVTCASSIRLSQIQNSQKTARCRIDCVQLTVYHNNRADFWEIVCVTCESSIRLSSSASACYVCDMTPSYVWHDSFIFVTWLLHVCDITHSYVQNDICGTWLLHMCDMTCSYVWPDSFMCVTLPLPMCKMTHS